MVPLLVRLVMTQSPVSVSPFSVKLLSPLLPPSGFSGGVPPDWLPLSPSGFSGGCWLSLSEDAPPAGGGVLRQLAQRQRDGGAVHGGDAARQGLSRVGGVCSCAAAFLLMDTA